mgnify:CR=1 FL=1
MSRIAFASDHAGYELKQELEKYVSEKGYSYTDFGTDSTASCDYPDYAHPAAIAIEKGECDFGICMCGSGNGIQMTLNKHQGIRAALCWKPELAALAKAHNNANVLALGSMVVGEGLALELIDAFLNAEFEGGRHQRRLDMLDEIRARNA